jgi:predicted dehydrogenase
VDLTYILLTFAGIFVKEEHLPAVQASDDLDLKAIYSRSLKSAKGVSEGLSGIELYSDDSDKKYKDLLERSDVHGVIIALPIPVQPDFIKQALSAGKHVFAEKPLAKDVATGIELVEWYHKNIDTKKVTFGIAEQFRYLNAFIYAAEQARSLGRVIGFRHKLGAYIEPGQKYFETEWRKKPEFQGGFLLDGGVHFAAGMRMLLGSDAKVIKASAFTAQNQEHMLPIDSVDATFKLANGATGNWSVSFGTTFTGAEWAVACEKGSVAVDGSKVTIKPLGGEAKVVEKPDELGGVKQEVFAWAKSLVSGKQEPQQIPEEGLADLEILEAMLTSGDNGGQPFELKHQI